MGTIGTFDSFTSARLGIYAAQHGLRVTGNNISNINTAGYTRQRINQVSMKTGGHDMYYSQLDNHVGNGALVKSINQIRDPYLDIRYRNSASDVGYSDTMLAGLKDIAAILDEVGKGENSDKKGDGMLYAQLQKLADALRAVSADPNNDNDTLARTSADALVRLFNTYADKLQTAHDNAVRDYEQDVASVNEILTNIRNLNDAIQESEIHGDGALELRDERNRQIDALSEYMHINVVYTMVDIGAGREVEKLTISLGNSNPDPSITTDSSVLIDGNYATQLSITQVPKPNPNFKVGDDPATQYLNNDGQPCAEDDPDVAMINNSNFDMALSKLYDSKGREWRDISTIWQEAIDGVAGMTARYETVIESSENWEKDMELDIGGQTYKIGTDISVSAANDPRQLASFIASKLNETNADYKVFSEGNKLVFVAKKAGAIGGTGPANAPNLTFTPGAGGTITFGNGNNPTPVQVRAGLDEVVPTLPNPNPTIDKDGNKVEVSNVLQDGKWYQATTITKYSKKVDLHDNDLHGSLQATRELLTEKGEFSTQADVDMDPNATSKRGIPYYQKSLDLLARQFANQYNKLNQGFMFNQNGNYIGADNKELQLAGGPISKTNGLTAAQKQALIDDGCVLDDGTPDLNRWLEANGAKTPEGMGVLFSNRGDGDNPDNITAANISISQSWTTGDVKIVPTFQLLFGEDGNPLPGSTLNENANHMVTMIGESLVYDPKLLDEDAVGKKLFTGSFNDMFSNMMTVQGNDELKTNISLNSHYGQLIEIDTSRDGVSGVDLNDEAMNMMQYQKAYSAACRLMTAIDEAIDRLINNTGIAGR